MRAYWLRLAELLAGAPDDEAASKLFTAATGLSGSDLEADREELARRLAEADKRERDRAADRPRPTGNDQAPPEREWECGCITRDGVFLPCYDHIDSGYGHQ